MQKNDPKCPGCGRTMIVPVYRDHFNKRWVAICRCNECETKWHTGEFTGATKIEAAEKAVAAALTHPSLKPLDFEDFADRARNGFFVPVLETREVCWPQTNIKVEPALFDLQDIRRNDAYAYYLFGEAEPRFLKLDEYGITWRCWEDMPTQKEQDAAPWRKENGIQNKD